MSVPFGSIMSALQQRQMAIYEEKKRREEEKKQAMMTGIAVLGMVAGGLAGAGVLGAGLGTALGAGEATAAGVGGGLATGGAIGGLGSEIGAGMGAALTGTTLGAGTAAATAAPSLGSILGGASLGLSAGTGVGGAVTGQPVMSYLPQMMNVGANVFGQMETSKRENLRQGTNKQTWTYSQDEEGGVTRKLTSPIPLTSAQEQEYFPPTTLGEGTEGLGAFSPTSKVYKAAEKDFANQRGIADLGYDVDAYARAFDEQYGSGAYDWFTKQYGANGLSLGEEKFVTVPGKPYNFLGHLVRSGEGEWETPPTTSSRISMLQTPGEAQRAARAGGAGALPSAAVPQALGGGAGAGLPAAGGVAGQAAGSTPENPVKVASPQEAASLPKGTYYVDAQGNLRRR